MNFIYERNIHYYETDAMGIVHHSNYIRFLEEARCDFLVKVGLPYDVLEKNGIMIPVLGVELEYKTPSRFSDTISIDLNVAEFDGIKMSLEYTITNKSTGALVVKAKTKHCFTNSSLRPISLKKVNTKFYDVFKKIMDN